MRALRISVAAVLLVLSFGQAPAHTAFQSAVLLDFEQNVVRAELQLPLDRLSMAFGQIVDAQSLTGQRSALQAYVLPRVQPVTDDGRPYGVRLDALDVQTVEGAPYLVVKLHLTPPAGTTVDRFTLHYDVIARENSTHVALVSIRSDPKLSIAAKDPLLIGVIRGNLKSVAIDRTKRQ